MAALALSSLAAGASPAASPGSVELPLIIDHGRLLVAAEARLPDGSWRPLRLWIDTGTPSLLLAPALRRELGPGIDGPDWRSALVLRLGLGGEGSLELDLSAAGKPAEMPAQIEAATGAEANLPASVLSRHRVVFDFPRGRLSLEAPGPRPGRGTRLAASLHPATGILSLQASLAGQDFGVALDLGASFSLLDAATIEATIDAHPEWPRVTGSAGIANMWGGLFFPPESSWRLLRPAALSLGPLELEGLAFAVLPPSGGRSLGPWYSRKTAAPVAGLLGPNAFRGWRLEIDYGAPAIWLERGEEGGGQELDTLPFALAPDGRGGWLVAAVCRRDGISLAANLAAGDRLLAVDGRSLEGLTMGGVSSLLAGRPGERRLLLVERGGAPMTLEAEVTRLP